MTQQELLKLSAECRRLIAGSNNPIEQTKVMLNALLLQLDALDREMELEPLELSRQTILERQLTALKQAVEDILLDGPGDHQSEMFKTYSSNRRIIGLGLWAVVGLVSMILALLTNANKLIHLGMPAEIAAALPLIATMGSIGGFLASIQSFGQYVGNRQLLRSWTIYYLLFPLKGAGLAIIVFFLMHTELGQRDLDFGKLQEAIASTTNALVSSEPNSNVSITNNQTITNQLVTRIRVTSNPVVVQTSKKPNLVMAALVAALTGMFANQAIQMLAGIFSRIFAKVEAKDQYTDGQGEKSKQRALNSK